MTQQQPVPKSAANEADVLEQQRRVMAEETHPESNERGDNEERIEPADDLGYGYDET
jgi:hypothetical protein